MGASGTHGNTDEATASLLVSSNMVNVIALGSRQRGVINLNHTRKS